MKTPITRWEWEDLAISQGKGIRDNQGRVWKVLGPRGTNAPMANLALQIGDVLCVAIWDSDEIWTNYDGTGIVLEPCLNDPSVEIVDVP